MTDKKGFTLVELSIVWVVVGLLIGGILVAQSMIGAAKITGVASQISQFDAGVMNFKTKYNYLPGDAPAFGGDGDGNIDRTAGCGGADNAVNVYQGELEHFWKDFDSQFAGSSPCSGTGSKAISVGAGKNVPASKLGSPNSFFIASALAVTSDVFVSTSNIRNYYALLDGTQLQILIGGTLYRPTTTTSTNSAVKPVDLLALDKKLDDGGANTGIIISGAVGNEGIGYGGVIATPLATCSAGATYQIQNNTYECTPLIRIGGQTGVLQ